MNLGVLLIALTALSAAFGLLYIVARRLNNFGVVDVAWAAAFTPVAWLYATTGAAPLARRVMIGLLVTVWSLRLATHLGVRVGRQHPIEDGRYQQLRRDWGRALGAKMAAFFQAQALVVLIFSWPVYLVCANRAAGGRPWEWAGAAIVLLAVTGEALADAQLSRFKARTANRGRVCDAGLWRYSRHPNYFFEWLTWVGFAACAAPAPLGWSALLCPVLMLYLLLRVTGLRYTEEQLARSKGPAYEAYRRRTPAFFPWLPRATTLPPHD